MADELYDVELFRGRYSAWSGVHDWHFDPVSAVQKFRKLHLGDIGDPPDLMFRRVGPDDVPFDHFPPEACTLNQNLGTMGWQAYEGTDLGFPAERCAQVYARYRGRGMGSLHIQTSGLDRVIIEDDGTLNLEGVPIENDHVRIRRPDGRIGYLAIKDSPV